MTVRPSLIVYGDCQARGLADGLRRIPRVAQEFSVHFAAAFERQVDIIAPDILERCAVFWRQVGKAGPAAEYQPDLPAGARTVTFPAVFLSAVWPIARGVFPPEPPRYPHGLFSYGDWMLVALGKSAHDESTIAARYADMLADPGAQIVRAMEGGLRSLIEREDSTNVKIAAYIYAYFRTERLFWTRTHPTGALLAELLDRLLQQTWPELTKPGAALYRAGHAAYAELDPIAYDQWIVTPNVARSLGLQWWRPDDRYQVHGWGRAFTAEEYVREFVSAYRERFCVAV